MKKALLILLIFLFVITTFPFDTHAISIGHGLVTTEVSSEDRDRIIKNIDMELLSTEPTKQAIACFDVSKDGLIALGFNTSPKKTVLVYDSNGTFLYGYSFFSSGSIGINFVGKNLSIFFARSNLVATYSPTGGCLALENVTSGKVNSAPQKAMLYTTEKVVDDLVYRLDRDAGVFMQSYSRLIVIDAEGTEHILYDVSPQYNIGLFIFGVVSFGFIVCAVLSVINRVKKRKYD